MPNYLYAKEIINDSTYSMMPSIRPLKTEPQFLWPSYYYLFKRRIPIKSYTFQKVLVGLQLEEQLQKGPLCSDKLNYLGQYLPCLLRSKTGAVQ